MSTKAKGTQKAEEAIELTPADPSMNLTKRLKVGKQIAIGGIGRVLEAADSNLNRRAALKTLKKEKREDPHLRKGLIEEAQVTAQLDHQCIVPVFELGIDGQGNLFFTMKKIKGETLTKIISKHFRKRDDNALRDQLEIFMKVCDAVAFAHEKGVLHQDIKPDNIMAGDHGEVYLMDWGAAKLKDSKPLTKKTKQDLKSSGRRLYDLGDHWACLTLPYLPPELLKRAPFDERSDQFCLGGVLYKILTNRAPWAGTEKELLQKIKTGKMKKEIIPHPKEVVRRRLYPGLCDIAMKALSKNPDKRYGSVIELKEAVQGFLSSDWRFQVKFFAAGETIVSQGEDATSAFIIARGTCHVFQENDDVEEFLREMNENDVFGETAFFTGGKRTATVKAVTNVIVKEVNFEHFRVPFQGAAGTGQWVKRFIEEITKRFLEKEQRVIALEKQLREHGVPVPE